MSSSLYHPRPVLSSQRYSPPTDYVDARRGSTYGAGRLPLREANGNAQSHNFNGMVSCYPNSVGLSPSMPSNIPAPMVPSQSFDCLYRVSTPRNQPRYQRRARNSVNPLYYWPAFRQYRNRQAHKDTQKDKGGVWRRPELEDAFVDCKSLSDSGNTRAESLMTRNSRLIDASHGPTQVFHGRKASRPQHAH
jgi:transcriptional enhancer factor